MPRPLDGKVAVVTGAGRGIGAACASVLAENGAAIAAVDADADALARTETALTGLGGRVRAIAADPVRLEDVRAVVPAAVAALGRVDILVNASSTPGTGGTLIDMEDAEWDAVHLVNLTAPRLLMAAAARQMIAQGQGGKIVSISSSSGSRAAGVRLAYGCSKAGLNALTRIAAAQLAPHDINVNAVAPGVTATPLQRGLRTEAEMKAAVSDGELANFFKRVSEPEDVAAAVLFLCLPTSRQVTAQVIHTSAGVVV